MLRKIKLVNNVEAILNIYNLEDERGEKEEGERFINDTEHWTDSSIFFQTIFSPFNASSSSCSSILLIFTRGNFLLLCRFPSDIFFIFIPFWIRVERLFIGKYVSWFNWGGKKVLLCLCKNRKHLLRKFPKWAGDVSSFRLANQTALRIEFFWKLFGKYIEWTANRDQPDVCCICVHTYMWNKITWRNINL